MANLAKAPSSRAEDARAFGRALLEAARMAELGASPSGAKTVKWAAAQGFDATLAAFPAAASRSPSSVEITLAGDRVNCDPARTRWLPLGIGFFCIDAL